MKKFQSFEGIANYLHTEEVPFKDNKDKILRNINAKNTSPITSYKKLSLVFAALLILITSVAFAYGYIKEHEKFVEAHDGVIQAKLTDDKGNIVVQIGAMKSKNYAERKKESEQRRIVSDRFLVTSRTLENQLPNDKIALFIPVKGLESITDFQVLNWIENYFTIEETRENISSNSPLPKYIPEGFVFSKSLLLYGYEDFYKPYEDKMIYKEFLTILFEEAKREGKDYYYKEYARFNEVNEYRLEYDSVGGTDNAQRFPQGLTVNFKKGPTTVLYDGATDKMITEVIEHNEKKYLRERNTYYTYIYIDDELWTIEIRVQVIIKLGIEEISKIIESIEFQ